MSSYLLWVLGYSSLQETTEKEMNELTPYNTMPSIDVLKEIIDYFGIVVERKSNSTLTFKRKNENEYFAISVAPCWDVEIKDVYPEWYINELFHPRRKTILEFVKWLDKLTTNGENGKVKLGKCKNNINDIDRINYFIEITHRNNEDKKENQEIKLYIIADINYNIRVEYYPPHKDFEYVPLV